MTAHHGVPDEADALEVAEGRLQALNLRDEPLAAPANPQPRIKTSNSLANRDRHVQRTPVSYWPSREAS